jgi:hypothetical protein
MSQNIYQGDNTAAFGGNFLTIDVSAGEGIPMPTITKAELKIGCFTKVIENPTFPITINLTEEETTHLKNENTAYLAVWDVEGRKKTCEGSLVINTNPQRV